MVLFLAGLCLLVGLPGFFSLPPLDRDEARFAQAAVQMSESGEYFDIRFQDQQRYKKPPGAYWLQVAALHLDGKDARRIWVHRLPSLLAAIGAVLLLFLLGIPLVGKEAAAFAAAFLGTSVLLVVEAHQAKTDALLLLCTVAAQLSLARIWLACRAKSGGQISKQVHDREGDAIKHRNGRLWRTDGFGLAMLFWFAQAGGLLLKGPVLALVTFLTIVALIWSQRQWRWLAGLYPVVGVIALIMIVGPVGYMLELATAGAFTAQAVGGDMLPKLLSGQESHGAWPGYFLLLLPFTFWPASLFVLPALQLAWQVRRHPVVVFVLAWLVPSWLVFELIPTKLPHYVLPLYPALAILSALFVTSLASNARQIWQSAWPRFSVFVWLIPALLLTLGAVLLPLLFGQGLSLFLWLLAPFAIAFAAAAVAAYWHAARLRSALLVIGAAIFTYATTLQFVLPQLPQLQLSTRAVELFQQEAVGQKPVAAVGYHEPSLVYLAGTDTRLVSAAEAAALVARDEVSGVLIVEPERGAFQTALLREGASAWRSSSITGLNYSRGEWVTLHLFLPGSGPSFRW
jgi:4-amino-4-deoxy-L-arabinose transferase-like glycosyltransferase